MSFVFRGTRGDIETGLPVFVPERRAVVNASSLYNDLISHFVLLYFCIQCMQILYGCLFNILKIHTCLSISVFMQLEQSIPIHLLFLSQLWLVLGVFLMATSLRMYATCQQLQAQAQAHAMAASGLLGHTELRLHMPPSIALATRGRLQGLRLQLALLDREFDDLDYDTLRALDSDNAPAVPSMSDEEINSLPVHKYKVIGAQSGSSTMQQASSSVTAEKKQDTANVVGNTKASEDELTCSVCLEQVTVGELVRSLPCLHQFHANCIDPWLRQQGTCPVCKFKVGSGWHESGPGEIDASYMV
ncbi:hypothetical protein RHMOL_Rhmol09G0225600 [Rhododendron molle]|uniref:Uncharacterized protein n=1 Tax=Rhododendron molle TaxID=49168 RepID=A0ACC0MHL7_RHOML|nr:hypothetical protein RHMOL_Rhmol09G0225600 [Rhododendron molle]